MLTQNGTKVKEYYYIRPQDDGGNITINDPLHKLKVFSLTNSKLLANANRGQGGEIKVFVETFTGYDSEIDVSSRVGLNGKFFLNSVGLSEIEILPEQQQAERKLLLPSRCASFSKANMSRFIITARDVLPPTPEDLRH